MRLARWYSKVLFILAIACLCTLDGYAQYENHVWFFGGSSTGIQFDLNTNAPSPWNVQYTPYGNEGCGVVTDRITGQLQFYSDGATLVNRNHQVMANGAGLGGCPSSAQAVAFTQVPGVCNHYYVYSNWRGSSCPSSDLRYSVVDMNANNGLGEVVLASKNTLLRTGVKEGMIVIPIPNSKDFWLVGADGPTGQYYVYKVDINGVNFSGTYNLGACGGSYNLSYSAAAGKMAVCCYSPGMVEVMDFNINTGVISNLQVVDNSMPRAYDSEWSPDGTKLYYSSWTQLEIRQYDFNTGNITSLATPGTSGGGLRLGPDGYIYHISNNAGSFLSRITNPNGTGAACNYVLNDYNAGGPATGLNLPEMLTTTNILEISLTEDSTNLLCNSDNSGTAQVSPVGGNPPYNYIWSNTDTTQQVTGLAAGTYTVTVTDSLNCRNSATFIIEEPDSFLVSVAQVTNASCNGVNDGAIDVDVAGGTIPYSYLWNDAVMTQDRTGITAGNYSATIADANGCVDSVTALVAEPSAILLSSNVADALCNGDNSGRITLNASGSVLPYTFNWSNGTSQPFADSLLAGIYTVTVTDDTGCTGILTDTVGEPTLLALTATPFDVNCHGGNDGSIDLDVTGATPPYSYVWSNGQGVADANGLSVGSYSVTVTDANGCQDILTLPIGQPDPWQVSILRDSATCFGYADGYAELIVSGATPSYSFQWSDVSSVDAPQINTLPAGNQSVTITDMNGCDTVITFTIEQPEEITVTVPDSIEIRLGAEDSVTVLYEANGDSTTFSWSPDFGLSCNDCQEPVFSPFVTTTYTVTMSDNGCTVTDELVVVVDPDPKIFFVPNAFSPNEDGANDLWQVEVKGTSRVEIDVFNRWGELVYQADNLAGWDGTFHGKLLDPGVYVYHVYVEFLDRTADRKVGSVVLLR